MRIYFLHLLLCPAVHLALLKHSMSMHDCHLFLLYYSVQGSGVEQPTAATSVGMQNSHVSSGSVNI